MSIWDEKSHTDRDRELTETWGPCVMCGHPVGRSADGLWYDGHTYECPRCKAPHVATVYAFDEAWLNLDVEAMYEMLVGGAVLPDEVDEDPRHSCEGCRWLHHMYSVCYSESECYDTTDTEDCRCLRTLYEPAPSPRSNSVLPNE